MGQFPESPDGIEEEMRKRESLHSDLYLEISGFGILFHFSARPPSGLFFIFDFLLDDFFCAGLAQ